MAWHDGIRRRCVVPAVLIIPLACAYPKPYVAVPEDIRSDDTGIDIVLTADLLRVNDTVQAQCYILHRDGTRRAADTGVSWSAGNPLVLDAGPSGLIRALGAGSADIVAEAGGFSASRRIIVEAVPDYSGLVISEVCYDPKDEEAEYIEMHNRSAEDLNVSGLGVVDGNPGSTEFIIPPGNSIPAGGYLVIARRPDNFAAEFYYSKAIGYYSFSLSNSGECVFIKLNDGTVLDSVYIKGGTATYPAPDGWCETKHPVSGDGQSVFRISPIDTNTCADWSAGTPTPGN